MVLLCDCSPPRLVASSFHPPFATLLSNVLSTFSATRFSSTLRDIFEDEELFIRQTLWELEREGVP